MKKIMTAVALSTAIFATSTFASTGMGMDESSPSKLNFLSFAVVADDSTVIARRDKYKNCTITINNCTHEK